MIRLLTPNIDPQQLCPRFVSTKHDQYSFFYEHFHSTASAHSLTDAPYMTTPASKPAAAVEPHKSTHSYLAEGRTQLFECVTPSNLAFLNSGTAMEAAELSLGWQPGTTA